VAWLAPAGAAGAPSVADLAAHCGRVGLVLSLARALPQPGFRRSRPTVLPATGPLGISRLVRVAIQRPARPEATNLDLNGGLWHEVTTGIGA